MARKTARRPQRCAATHMRTALAVGAAALLPALAWQAGDIRSPAFAAPVANVLKHASVASETVIGKASSTWTHKKADRLAAVLRQPATQVITTPGQPDTIVEVISLDADADGLTEAPVNEAALAAERAAFSGWLDPDAVAGSVQITSFATQRSGGGRNECRATHDGIVRAFSLAPDAAKVLADKPVMFQSSICAANGEIVITCHGATALVSPRRVTPVNRCSKRQG